MKNYDKVLVMLNGHLADEINAIIQYVAFSKTCDNSGHAELHKAILEMHDDFQEWLEKRIAFMDQASATSTVGEGSQS